MPLAAAPDEPQVPLVVGVVGHRMFRSAEDAAALKAALRSEIEAFKAAYEPTPIVVLTSLAEGADTLAAQAADDCGVRLRALLPMPADAYQLTISEDARGEFERWWCHPSVEQAVIDLTGVLGPPPASWEDVAQGDAEELRSYRRRAYAYGGFELVRYCDVLIALWDGTPPVPESPSGTAEFVALKLEGLAPTLLKRLPGEPLGLYSERGPVVVLHAPRDPADPVPPGTRDVRTPMRRWAVEAGATDPPAVPHPIGYSNGDAPLAAEPGGSETIGEWLAGRWETLKKVLRAIAERPGHAVPPPSTETDDERKARDRAWGAYEIRLHRHRCQVVAAANRDFRNLPLAKKSGDRERGQVRGLFTAEFEPALDAILRTRAAASAAAVKLDESLVRRQRWVSALLFASLLAFHLYAHVFAVPPGDGHPEHHPTLLGVSLLLILIAAAVALATAVRGLHRRRLEYRALAEALRVRLWWCVAGVSKSVALAYPGQVRNEVAWIRQAVRNLSGRPRHAWAADFNRRPDQQRERLRTVRESWIADQAKYLAKNAHGFERRNLLLKWGGGLAAFSGWAGMARLWWEGAHHPSGGALVVLGMLTIAGGLAIGYSQHRTYEELANQYERLRLVFRNGLREFDARLDAGDVAGAQEVCEALGLEAIHENGQWLMTRRAKPLEVPVA